jgi:prepilin-type N-terminal cleavage/methylation domain-containing protein
MPEKCWNPCETAQRGCTAHRDGFTLLEVLVALIIISVSMGAIFQAFSQSKQIAWRSTEVAEATRIANNLLSDASLIEEVFKDKERKGELKDEPGWRYALSFVPLEVKGESEKDVIELPAMWKLHLCVTHETGVKNRSFCLDRWYRR